MVMFMRTKPSRHTAEAGAGTGLFLRRWAANPFQMRSVVPSGPALCRRLLAQVRHAPGEWVLELGAGTGAVSRALLAGGIPAERITVVEIVPDMARYLKQSLPGVEVIEAAPGPCQSCCPKLVAAKSAP